MPSDTLLHTPLKKLVSTLAVTGMGGQPQDCERTECLVGHGKASHLHNVLSQPATCRATAVINTKRDTDVLER